MTPTGEFVTASDTEHEDLFWALRGGGGVLGVVAAFGANWEDPATDEANMEWARDCVKDMRQFSDGSVYLNFPGFFEGGDDLLETTFGRSYERLATLKDEYDPTGVFRRNEDVSDAGAPNGA